MYLRGVDRRALFRRVAAAVIITAQLVLVVAAYPADHAYFGFQMFPESSRWRADIYRITATGNRVDVRHDWPGGYRWDELIDGRGLGNPFTMGQAFYGIDSQLALFRHALQWVADHTPNDTESVALEADITYRHNDDPAHTITIRTRDRGVP